MRWYARHACLCRCWLCLHFSACVYMYMHESYLLVCLPCFNTMKLWTSDPNLHLSLADTTFCLLSCMFAYLSSFFLVCLRISLVLSPATRYACHVCHAYLLYASFIHSLHIFLPLLVYLFLVFAFACTHMERECMELGHGLPSASKKSEDASKCIQAKWLCSIDLGVQPLPFGYVLF